MKPKGQHVSILLNRSETPLIMAFRTLALQFWNYLLFQIRVKGLPSPVLTVKHNRSLRAVQIYYQLNTKAEISQNRGPLFQSVNDTVYWLCATFTAQFTAVYHLISGTQPLTDQVWESSVLDKWKMSKMLMKERPRPTNANWQVTSRRRPQCIAAKSKASYTLSVKLSDYFVWCHTWRKNWVNCAVLRGNSTGFRTVFSSRLSHKEMRSSLRESHSFLR